MLGAIRGVGRALRAGARRCIRAGTARATTTVFHVTHHKAGSQWINRIFHALAYDRLVHPAGLNDQFLTHPIQPGKVYPTVYVTAQEFAGVALPRNSRRFVVIRDLRDTLVSAYFSVKNTHPLVSDWIGTQRDILNSRSVEDGFLFMLDTMIPRAAQIQWSWLAAGEPLIKYEELLTRDEEILERVLLGRCRLPVTRERLREVIRENRFESRTGGRRPGTEDRGSHERKGVAGDWRNHFTATITRAFKARYGSLLIATGYERGFNW
jgi:lipopolysaccharide transport system ATP-binding protein